MGSEQNGKRLLLWDIDGTLITTGRAGEKALRMAAANTFGGDGDLAGVEIAGRTDSGIVHQILTKYRAEISDAAVAAFIDRYLGCLARSLPDSDGHVLPGVLGCLTSLAANEHAALGLLTGNIRRGAMLKLEHYGLWRFFEFGAFADDHHDRNELGPFARQRAYTATGYNFAPEQIDVIGDTPHDIACGKAIGARTIAIATGSFTREQLSTHEPDVVLENLSDAQAVMAQLGWCR